jgi:hypothetical protein
MTTREIVLKFPVLHQAQQTIRASKARFRVLACGRRFGKTLLITDEGLESLAMGDRVAYFNLSYKQGREVWESFKRLAAPIIKRKDENERRIETITGGILDMWSLDNEKTAENALGRYYDKVLFDEAARVPNLLTVWDKTISPMLMDTGGEALFASSPNGLNDFYTLFQRGNDPLFPDWKSFHYPTSANPYIRPEEIEAARREKTAQAFAQEIEAAFLADGSGVFRGVSKVTTAPMNAVPMPGFKYVCGIDWGRSQDFTVIVVFCVETMEMVAIDRFNQIEYAFQRERLKTVIQRWQPVMSLVETNSIGEVNIEELRRDGIEVTSFTTTANSKPPLIEELAIAVEKGKITLMPDPVLLNEMNAFTMTRGATGRPSYSAPSGGHDDTVIALALAYDAALRNQASGSLEWLGDFRG